MDAKKVPRGGPGRFFRDVWAELKRVVWPTRRQLQIYTLVVIGSVFVVAAILFFFDLILAGSLLRLFSR
ncbi:MAG: preprotein translocase subunit SecE [Firmicutes bacterium]|nr:preprotein translocase subunit SecE [Bacillota bacterium]